jgi:hypothetical protein
MTFLISPVSFALVLFRFQARFSLEKEEPNALRDGSCAEPSALSRERGLRSLEHSESP